MSDYPMLISNKLHSFRNFCLQRYTFLGELTSKYHTFLGELSHKHHTFLGELSHKHHTFLGELSHKHHTFLWELIGLIVSTNNKNKYELELFAL